jgi:hypothetical protein
MLQNLQKTTPLQQLFLVTVAQKLPKSVAFYSVLLRKKSGAARECSVKIFTL